MGIGVALVMFGQLTANIPITSYAVLIFKKSGTSFDPSLISIMLPVMHIFGSLFSTYFADLIGRKLLIFISLLGSALGLFGSSLYQYLVFTGYDMSMFE